MFEAENGSGVSALSSPAPPRPPPPGGASHLADLLSDVSTTTDSTASTATTVPVNASATGDFGNFDFLSMETSSAPSSTGDSAPAALYSSPSKQVTQGAVF